MNDANSDSLNENTFDHATYLHHLRKLKSVKSFIVNNARNDYFIALIDCLRLCSSYGYHFIPIYILVW